MEDDIPDEPATTFDLLTSLVDCADPVQVNTCTIVNYDTIR